jgi:hypothetical protein
MHCKIISLHTASQRIALKMTLFNSTLKSDASAVQNATIALQNATISLQITSMRLLMLINSFFNEELTFAQRNF